MSSTRINTASPTNIITSPATKSSYQSSFSSSTASTSFTHSVMKSRSPRSRSAGPSTTTTSAAAKSCSAIPDRHYGYREAACSAARFILSLYHCPNIPAKTSPSSPQPSLDVFIAYALHRTRLPTIVTTSALHLLLRLKARFPEARGSSGHRLFLSALMTASKMVCDDSYSNQSWCIVGQGMFALKEVNQMERELLGYLKWDINVTVEECAELDLKLRTDYSGRPPCSSSNSGLDSITSSSSSSATTAVRSIPISECTLPDAYPSPPCSPMVGSYTSVDSSESSPSSCGPCATPPNTRLSTFGPFNTATNTATRTNTTSSSVVAAAAATTTATAKPVRQITDEMDEIESW
ncbi:Cyclin [Phaffia rhodozyma]|uniref:Cyclin n=1 Tax=Phaffia rhodozyma TaxID=264483 RepID=A0A0F7SFS9_PHARH|nr:Cyclin [Phaffia rhodozyma]